MSEKGQLEAPKGRANGRESTKKVEGESPSVLKLKLTKREGEVGPS